jgi:hypothetical protein
MTPNNHKFLFKTDENPKFSGPYDQNEEKHGDQLQGASMPIG